MAPEPRTRVQRTTESVYVVQRAVVKPEPELPDDPDSASRARQDQRVAAAAERVAAFGSRPVGVLWEDIATVTVPPNTLRKTVYQKALEMAGIKPDPEEAAPRLRALDAASSAVVTMEPFQPPTEWKVGG